ncbi:hypothetical protein DFJ77DRAFT_324944 [Powellomyces hirtus]|nr:hypothetical protein DFJ77DRAFT_324944 [Powellomyces hirtus]
MSAFWPFSAWSIPQSLQKRLLKFLLKRAIGQFLASEIDLDKLDVEFGRGQVSLHDLELNLEVLNDLTADLPFIVTDGHITRINALIPWKDLGNSDCTLELDGLHMELTSIMDDPENGLSKSTQMSESHIMSSSVHFAENFLRSEISGDDDFGPTMDQIPGSGEPISPVGSSPSGLEGIQVLTRLIDKILARVKVTAKNTTIRIVHRSYHSIADGIESDFRQEYHLDLTFPFLMYEDETSTMQNEADQDSYAGGMTEDRQKRIRFSGITISLNQTSVEDPTGHSGVDLRDSRVRKPTTQPSYSYTAILASTSTKQEDNIRITVKGTSTDSDGRLHAPRLDVEILVDSLCALILPEQLVVMSEVFDLMGEGQAFLARNRQYGDDSDINFRSASSPGSHRSPSSPSETKRGSWPNHGYPAAGEYISDVDTPDPRHLRIRLGITQMSVYLITQRSHTSIDATQFYTLYFGGKNAARHAADFPTDLSMSFVTKLNTRLNTGTISMDDILGESLKVDHIRIGLSDILALVGYETGKATKSDKDSSDLLIRDATISEWRSSPRRDTETSGAQVGSYHAILVFELGANVEKVSDLYAQLSGSQPPLANLYRPLTKGPGGLPAAFPLDVKQSRTYAISLSVERPSSGTSNVDAGGGKSNVEEICIKLAPLHVYLSVPLLDRLRRIMPQKGNSQAGMPETLPDSLSSVGQSVGALRLLCYVRGWLFLSKTEPKYRKLTNLSIPYGLMSLPPVWKRTLKSTSTQSGVALASAQGLYHHWVVV